jgi:hypothetical protein
MPDAEKRAGSPNEFELFDNPRGGRVAGIGLALLGAAFILGIWWEFPQGRGEQIGALLAAAIGAFAVYGGVRMFRRSRRSPYLLLRADASGLRLVERFRFHGEPVYVLLPWAQIRDFRLRAMGEAGYAIEIHADLPAEEEQRLRSGQKFISPPGILLFEVPLNWLPVREEWIMDTLRAIGARGRGDRQQA